MSNRRPAKGRIPLPPDLEREILRRGLIALYRADRRYKLVVAQDLRSLWIPLKHAHSRYTRFSDLCELAEEQVWHEEDGGSPHDPALAAYVQKIQRTVSKTMGLMFNDEPAIWVGGFVHADTSGHIEPFESYSAWYDRATVHLSVSRMNAVIRTVVPDDSGDEDLIEEREIDAISYLSFDEWAELRQAAHAALDRQVDRLRERFKERHGAFRNVQSLQRQQKDLRTLFACLYHRWKPHTDDNTRERLRVLALKIGIDPPSFRA